MRSGYMYRICLLSVKEIENDRTRPNLLHTGFKPGKTTKKRNEG